jgi:TPP-dependent pyruvate/acetoin dehydrogenase alpha subunit
VSARKTKSTNSISKTQPRIPAEVTDSALISARLVQRIHRSLLMCHLLEARVAALGNKSAINRVHRGDGAMVIGATIGLGSRDIVITLGDTLLPHVTREIPLKNMIRQLAQPPPTRSAISVRQLNVAQEAASSAANEGRVVLLLCTEIDFAEKAARLAEHCSSQSLPLVALVQCDHPPAANATPVIPVEAHDAIAIYRVTQEALWRARRRTGPTIIAVMEATPQAAMSGHFESEALVRLREYMQRHSAWDEAATGRLRLKLEADLDKAFAATKLSS